MVSAPLQELHTDVFPSSEELEKSGLAYIESLNECSIDTDDDSLFLVEVLEFTLIKDEREEHPSVYSLSYQILEDYNCSLLLEITGSLYSETPVGTPFRDADTILKDHMDSIDEVDYTGIFSEFYSIWNSTSKPGERLLLRKMFSLFTGMDIREYALECIAKTTRRDTSLKE